MIELAINIVAFLICSWAGICVFMLGAWLVMAVGVVVVPLVLAPFILARKTLVLAWKALRGVFYGAGWCWGRAIKAVRQ